VTVRLYNGTWLLVGGRLATDAACCCAPPCTGPCDDEHPCPEDCFCCEGECQSVLCEEGACCVDGECQDGVTAAACAALGGVYQGDYTTCEDGDCADKCCVASENEDGCPITVCSPGYFASNCAQACFDPDAPNPPTSGLRNCQESTSLHNTVTFSGVTFNTGSPTLDAFLDDAMNNSYAITRDSCDGNNTAAGGTQISFSLPGGRLAIVSFPGLTVRNASINIFDFTNNPPLLAAMERNDGFRSSVFTGCGAPLYDCDEGVSGPPTSTGGTYGDYSSADITTS
jgi:hypothetical protein